LKKKPNNKLTQEIEKQTGLHFFDSVHVAIALENQADLIVTWNKKDFEKAHKFIQCVSPKEISYIL